jgi:acyl-CoA synthetase (AMP-forming)/AMP-acid ligase II
MSDRTTLVSLLRERASRQPEFIAYTFLANGKIPEDTLTYRQLDAEARAIASHLQSRISPGDRALLIYPQGLDFLTAFFCCLYAGVIAIPAPEASRQKRIRPRLESIISDAQCSVILCHSKSLFQLESLIQDREIFSQLNWIATDTLAEQSEQETKELNINRDSIAYLQYTSGSTSAPKGVAIT